MFRLNNKVAIVTGGASGIGLSISRLFAQQGAVVHILELNIDQAEREADLINANGGEAYFHKVDVSKQKEVKKVIDKIAKENAIDILVNNAGITKDTLLMRMSDNQWDDVLRTNLTSVFNYCKAASKPMMKQREGSIVNISSVVGITGNAGQSNYAASKAGMIGFSKSLAKELASRNIRVNVVAPGYISTDMTGGLPESVIEKINAETPMGRSGNADEVASAVVFLASSASSFITGEVLKVDGGMAM
jgi:3-oxoacyl-[acyl-carrier protein] reductase